MLDYIEKLKKDLVEQFKGRPHIEGLIEAIGIQFNDLYAFFEQLEQCRNVYTATGSQLDGIGNIVSLTRAEAAKLDGSKKSTLNFTDDEYRKYLIYKILKNTCNCTYADIMKAVQMFWDGPPLRYSESREYPATILFDFDATSKLDSKALQIPFIKAGGIGMKMSMHKHDEVTYYIGLAMSRNSKTLRDCGVPVLDPQTYLTDELDVIMLDELGNWLVE